MAQALSPAELETALDERPGWNLTADGKAIRRCFEFKDFGQAFGFMAEVALAAEKLDHHPDWSNSWNKVDVLLTTHSADGLTLLDLRLARLMDMAFERRR